MNRTIKEATVKRYHYSAHEQLKAHLQTFLKAYNFAKRLKTLKGLTPYEKVIEGWQKEPERFRINPLQAHCGTIQVATESLTTIEFVSGVACSRQVSLQVDR